MRFSSRRTHIPLVILLVVFINGCHWMHRNEVDQLPRGERILCTNHANPGGTVPPATPQTAKYFEEYLKAGKVLFVRFDIMLYSAEKSRPFWVELFKPEKLKGKIEIREHVDAPRVVLGEEFQAGDVFKFKGMTWKILNMGYGGLWQKNTNDEICRFGFMHIKELEYYPPQK